VALGVGALSWLSGYSSGKLFLDWSGYARILFLAALITLWLLLALAFIGSRSDSDNAAVAAWAAKLVGLVILLVVPFLLYIASSPTNYPAVNPDTGGPTGASQLESSLTIVAILLMLPFGLTRRKAGSSRTIAIGWIVLVAECVLCVALGRADISHHRPAQYLSLGSLLVWLPLTPAYYAAFDWRSDTRRWRLAFLWWWAALVVTGWVFFSPESSTTSNSPMASSAIPSLRWPASRRASSSSSWSSSWARVDGYSIEPGRSISGTEASSPTFC